MGCCGPRHGGSPQCLEVIAGISRLLRCKPGVPTPGGPVPPPACFPELPCRTGAGSVRPGGAASVGLFGRVWGGVGWSRDSPGGGVWGMFQGPVRVGGSDRGRCGGSGVSGGWYRRIRSGGYVGIGGWVLTRGEKGVSTRVKTQARLHLNAEAPYPPSDTAVPLPEIRWFLPPSAHPLGPWRRRRQTAHRGAVRSSVPVVT